MRIQCPVAPSRRRFILVVIVLAALAFAVEAAVQLGTHEHARKVLWAGTDLPGHIAARFRFFDGSESRPLTASAGARLVVDYQLAPTSGALTLSVRGPAGGDLWTRRASAATQGSTALELPRDGRYRIAVTGQRSRGSFDVRYRTEAGGG